VTRAIIFSVSVGLAKHVLTVIDQLEIVLIFWGLAVLLLLGFPHLQLLLVQVSHSVTSIGTLHHIVTQLAASILLRVFKSSLLKEKGSLHTLIRICLKFVHSASSLYLI